MRLTITVPDDVASQARRLAAETDRSVSSIVAEAISDHVRMERKKRAADRISALIGTDGVSPDADHVLREIRDGSDRERS